MTDRQPLQADRRAVTPVVGAILLFAILTIAFASYQATVVPSQNNQVEFQHFEEVQDDMTEVRSAIILAKTTGQTQSATVTLGTRYPSRVIAVNPPPATGRLETGDPRSIQLAHGDTGEEILLSDRYTVIDDEDNATTRGLSYTPSYNVFDGAVPVRYEHGVKYLDYDGADGAYILREENQHLVQENRVTLLPLQGEYQESGIGTVTVEPEPGVLQSRTFDEPVDMTLPTKLLSESTWEDLLADELDPAQIIVDVNEETLTLELEAGTTIEFAPVGMDGTPISGERGDGQTDINPAGPGDVILTQADRRQDADAWDIALRNTGDDARFSEGRVSFYPGAADEVVEVRANGDVVASDYPWAIGGGFTEFDEGIDLPGDNERTDLTIEYDEVRGGDEWFVVEFLFDTGQQVTYFVSETVEEEPPEEDPENGEAPQITEFNLSNHADHQNHARIQVDFEAEEGDAGIDFAEVIIQHPEDEEVFSWNKEYDEAASIEETVTYEGNSNNADDTHTVTLTIIDDVGNEATEVGDIDG